MDTGCLDRIEVASRLAQMRAVIVPELAERVRSTCVAGCAASVDAEQITVELAVSVDGRLAPTPRPVGDSTPYADIKMTLRRVDPLEPLRRLLPEGWTLGHLSQSERTGHMPPLKTYDLFISHAWTYNDEYYRLIGLLDDASNFKYRNYSVPEHDPLGTRTGQQLWQALERQIRPVNCLLVLAGMYANHRDWMKGRNRDSTELQQAHRRDQTTGPAAHPSRGAERCKEDGRLDNCFYCAGDTCLLHLAATAPVIRASRSNNTNSRLTWLIDLAVAVNQLTPSSCLSCPALTVISGVDIVSEQF